MKNLYTLAAVAVVAIILIIAGTWYVNKGSSSSMATSTAATTTTTTGTATTKAAPSKTTTTTTGTVTTTTTVTPVVGPAGSAPVISSFAPSASSVGSVVTIKGTGFSTTKNYILFGTSQDLTHPDGSPDNSVVTVGSPDGKTLSFTVPATGPNGLLCNSGGSCNGVSGAKIVPGQYPVAVRNQFGTSATEVFTVTGS